MPAYNASAADLDGARLVGNFPLLPFRSSVRGPAAQPADPSIPDIIDESLQLFRANSLFRNFEIKTPADRALIYLILFIGDCLGRIAQARTWTHQDALKHLTTHSLSHFSLPGEPGFPLNQVFTPPSPPSPVEKDALRSWLVQARQETVVRLLERHVYSVADESTEGGKRPSKWWMAFSDFKSAATGVSAKAMRNELNAMIQGIDDPDFKKAFEAEMQSFFILFNRYLAERAKGQKIDWDKIQPPSPEQVVPYADLAESSNPGELLNKLAVLKLNGGLGTTMGCVGPKSVIEVREGMTFLDLSVRQIEHLNSAHNVNVPFILMNSFNTDDDTARIIQKYANHRIELMTFNQSRYPRVNKETLLPTPKSAVEDKGAWYPPGHGDLFDAIMNSGLVDKLLASGKEYLFVSNVDNLGAVVDTRILEHMHSSGAEFLMEVTDKTKADVKGGTLINYEGNVRLLEIAQVPNDHVEDFKSVRKFKIFNTNNLWINLRAIKRIMENDGMDLEIIVNHKQSDKGEAVIQLETAVGAAIKHFNNAHGINVPRSRFLPVKSCSDLLLITSDLYQLEHGQLRMNPSRMFQSTPVVKLGDHFKKVSAFQKRFKTIPSLLELDHLTVAGDVSFGRAVTLRGTVIIVANDGQRIELPDGTTLENKLVSGHLKLTDH
ncbi:UTP-glucose-1-phosphate uridylyltransferase [Rhodotorula toruloides]|uniref:UTP--glucose-1-phosphate uridylyltransferase n=1 Tax=Rhodotorula toruloides TaxID=5286 RepID=A0A511KF79_RHOTO|nr:UTP-glucose-1-phosphate uridylyltransferase [Rhodotorula toruloides]